MKTLDLAKYMKRIESSLDDIEKEAGRLRYTVEELYKRNVELVKQLEEKQDDQRK
jgi:hypothetical protein